MHSGSSKIGAISATINTFQKKESLLHSFKLVEPDFIIVGEVLISRFEEVRPFLSNNVKSIYGVYDRDTLQNPGKMSDKYLTFPF